MSTTRRDAYWRGTLRVTFLLLALWALVSFVLPWFARELSFRFLGWPFSFFLASQGALLAYLGIVWFYALRQSRRDREALDEEGASR